VINFFTVFSAKLATLIPFLFPGICIPSGNILRK
jgi:hypothetical protein